MHWAYWPGLEKGSVELKICIYFNNAILGKMSSLVLFERQAPNLVKFELVVCESKDMSP